MLFSLALILLCGLILSGVFQKLKLPGLLGMLLTGIILGPYVLNLISIKILDLSSDLRQIALIIILTRAGLSLDLKDLRKVGRSAILLSFIPSAIEIASVTFFAPLLIGISTKDAVLLGCILAAVSPAIVVPKMLKIIDSLNRNTNKVPQLVLAGSSVDIVFVLVLFTALLGSYQGGSFGVIDVLMIPVSIISGALIGGLIGFILVLAFNKIHVRDTMKILIILGISFLFISLESWLKPIFPISGLIAVITMSIVVLKQNESLGKRLSNKFSKIWVGAEVILFVLVGAMLDISYLPKAGLISILLIVIALLFRCGGVFIALLRTPLNTKERLFCAISYLPKATVQAAIGGIPLSMGISSGSLILTIAVVAILFTAPLGAIAIDMSYKKLLGEK